MLLEGGANPNIPYHRSGLTPLFLPCVWLGKDCARSVQVASLLLEHGANVNHPADPVSTNRGDASDTAGLLVVYLGSKDTSLGALSMEVILRVCKGETPLAVAARLEETTRPIAENNMSERDLGRLYPTEQLKALAKLLLQRGGA